MELLDSDVLIDVQRGHPPAVAWFSKLSVLPGIPGFVVMELVQDARNQREVQAALKLTAPFLVAWPTEADCQRALSLFTAHHLSDGLGVIDALIASTAIGLSAPMNTFNQKHYRAVSGLITAQPYVR